MSQNCLYTIPEELRYEGRCGLGLTYEQGIHKQREGWRRYFTESWLNKGWMSDEVYARDTKSEAKDSGVSLFILKHFSIVFILLTQK